MQRSSHYTLGIGHQNIYNRWQKKMWWLKRVNQWFNKPEYCIDSFFSEMANKFKSHMILYFKDRTNIQKKSIATE